MATSGPSTSREVSFMEQCDDLDFDDDIRDIKPKVTKRDDPIYDKYRFDGNCQSPKVAQRF